MNASDQHKWQRRKSERPGEIINAALALFVDKGYAATRLDEVAKRAGVSKGTVYLYFENKLSLFKAVIRQIVIPEIEKAEISIRDYSGTATELLKNMVHGWWQSVGESPLHGIPKLILAEAGNFPDVARFYHDEVVMRGRKMIGGIYQLGVERGEFRQLDADYVARLVISPLVYATIWKTSMAEFDPRPVDMRKFLDYHIDILLHGISVDKQHNGL